MEDKKDVLPDLYEQEWPKDADNRVLRTKKVSCDKDSHKFTYMKKAQEVKCECGIGYILSAGMEVWPNGHIYHDNNLVI